MCVRECITGVDPLPCGYISRVALAEYAVRFQSAAGLIQYICVYIKPVFIVSIVSLGLKATLFNNYDPRCRF